LGKRPPCPRKKKSAPPAKRGDSRVLGRHYYRRREKNMTLFANTAEALGGRESHRRSKGPEVPTGLGGEGEEKGTHRKRGNPPSSGKKMPPDLIRKSLQTNLPIFPPPKLKASESGRHTIAPKSPRTPAGGAHRSKRLILLKARRAEGKVFLAL